MPITHIFFDLHVLIAGKRMVQNHRVETRPDGISDLRQRLSMDWASYG